MPRAKISDMVGLFKAPWSLGIWIGIGGGVIGSVAGIVAVIVATASSGVPIWGVALAGLGTTLFVVAFLSVFYFAFGSVLGPTVQRGRLLETGEKAEATVISISDTGVTLNEIYPYVNMELEVRRKDKPAYRTSSKFLISRLDIPRYQPGSVIPVVVDPYDQNNVALGEGDGQPAMGEREAEEMLKKVDAANESLLARGAPAKATVLKAWEMGISVNGPNPAMKFLLQVTPEGQPAFQAEATAVIAGTSKPKYQPGNTIYVKYDAADTTRVAIDHS
jgi:hypothetical protein